jgi:pimeloyl-ACP methyl ester carboxylesterase
MRVFDHDGLRFAFHEEGQGLPFVFQHGLGGELSQPLLVYQRTRGVRLLGYDFRGHGQTRPLGDVSRLSIATLADDMVALLDHLGIDRAVVGGISLGAAVASNFALRFPGRTLGLVLSRPAWVDGPHPENVRLFSMIARLIREFGARKGLDRFCTTAEYEAIERESFESAASVIGQFTQPRAEECVARLERLPPDRVCEARAQLGAINVPTLVLGNHQDPIHPWDLATAIAKLIPGAVLRELTPKSISVEGHAADVQKANNEFLSQHFPGEV